MMSAEPDQPGQMGQYLRVTQFRVHARLTGRPLIEIHNDLPVDAGALDLGLPDLVERLALDPHQQHGDAEDGVDGDDDEPDEPLDPARAEPEHGQAERRLAPGGREDGEEAGVDGDVGHVGPLGHVIGVQAVAKRDAARGGGGRDQEGDLWGSVSLVPRGLTDMHGGAVAPTHDAMRT